MTQITRLDQKFWTDFSKNHWEKKPLFSKNIKSNLVDISSSEIFDILVLYADRCREQNNPEGFKFFIDGIKVEPEEVLEVLPERTDNSLLGYHDRMQAQFSDYCLVCDELLQVNLKYQQHLNEFTTQLYRHVGFPHRFSEIGLYLGNYRKTPFGVHVDSCGVFSFPVVGVKKFRLWPAAYGAKHPELDRAFQYEKHKRNSQVMEARPGDMTYWPSSEWHIAESDGSFNATWSLGVWVDRFHQDIFSENLLNLMARKWGVTRTRATTKFKKLHQPTGEVRELPKDYQDSIRILKSLTHSELQEIFLNSWMRHISANGFKNRPLQHSQTKISKKSYFILSDLHSPILWKKSHHKNKAWHFSFAGHMIESSSIPLFKYINSINSGAPQSLQTFYKTRVPTNDLKFLQTLLNCGAFMVHNNQLIAAEDKSR